MGQMHADDMDLVRDFAVNGSETAFATLVGRHVNLVYSAALRRLGNTHEAEEVAQAVFIILAKKACSLRRGTILSGWLYQTAQLAAANFHRAALRRQHREQEAFMQFAEQSERFADFRNHRAATASLTAAASGMRRHFGKNHALICPRKGCRRFVLPAQSKK
jgi:DNA-directed RNA polymerase specialized sigma24 family protein